MSDIVERLTYMAQVAKTQVVRSLFNAAASDICRLRNGLSLIASEPLNAEYMAQNILDGLPPYHNTMLECVDDGCKCKQNRRLPRFDENGHR